MDDHTLSGSFSMRFSGLFSCFHHSFVAWRILIFGRSYSSMIYILVWNIFIICWLDDFILHKKCIVERFVFLYNKSLTARRMIYILSWRICIIFCSSYGLYFAFVSFSTCCMIYILVWRIFMIFCLSNDLYSCLKNLYHFLIVLWFVFLLEEFVPFFARRMIYIFTWRICSIYAHCMIYILTWKICIICC